MDWITLLLLDLIEFGAAPETECVFHITPVDQISNTIVNLGESKETLKTAITLPETHTVTFKAIWTEICRQQAIEPHYLNVTEWRQKLNGRLKMNSQIFHGLQLFSDELTSTFSNDTTITVDAESDLNLSMFVQALLRN